jgi:hypothetical protein
MIADVLFRWDGETFELAGWGAFWLLLFIVAIWRRQ